MRIELHGVRKQFGKVTALRGVDLTLESGRHIALIGPNASGKSTFTRVIMGLLTCEGVVRVDGRDPHRERSELARKMAYVPQIAPQLRAPVEELVRAVAVVRELPLERIAATAQRLGVDLEAVRRQPFRNLSGGMKQKVLITLALSSGASLLILDEPTASLDSPTRERFFRLFDEVARDATVLLCSHRLDEVRRLVTHVVALEEGKLAYQGSVDAFLSQQPGEPLGAVDDGPGDAGGSGGSGGSDGLRELLVPRLEPGVRAGGDR